MYDKCYFCLDQLPKLKKESTASFFVNFGGAGVQKSRPTLLYLACACAPWFQQHSISQFFGAPCMWWVMLEINGFPWKYSIAPTKRLRENKIEPTEGQGDVGLFWDQRHKSRG